MTHIMLLQVLKSPYHGFLKMNIHVVWNIALSQWKHPAEIYIWNKYTVYKVIVFQKWESTLSLWNELFLSHWASFHSIWADFELSLGLKYFWDLATHSNLWLKCFSWTASCRGDAVFYIAKTVQPLVFIAQGRACEESVVRLHICNDTPEPSRHFNDESFKNINESKCGFASRLFPKEGLVSSIRFVVLRINL